MSALMRLMAFWHYVMLSTLPVRQKIRHHFIDHPKTTGESYLQHLSFTVVMAGRLVFVGLILLAHGIFPFLFTRTGSQQLDRIWQIMSQRKMNSTPPTETTSTDAN